MKQAFKFITFLVLAVLFYGFLLRPWFSTETLRNEVAVIEPGQLITYDMNLKFQRVVRLQYEVLEGGPVDVFLVPMDSVQPNIHSIEHIPGFSSISTTSGDTDALPENGKWSIVVMPSKGASNTPTKVKVITQIYRPRFFKRTEKTETMMF